MPDREHVSLWHSWQDKPGRRHKLALWKDFSFSSVEETVKGIADGRFYAVCNDILDSTEVDTSLLRDKRSEAYISRTGACVALRVRNKRQSGFLIPSSIWGSALPCREVLERMEYIFERFGYESLTPSSLSEKVLRSTLSERSYISRPSHMLRTSLLAHSKGGRIDKQEIAQFYPMAYENDMNKAYLHIASQGVPDPHFAPIRLSDGWQEYPTSWMHVKMTCHRSTGVQPIQVWGDDGVLREPWEGELIDDWLWGGEIQDCLEAGYTLHQSVEGWAFPFMSNFMSQWSDILWEKYSQETDEHIQAIEKSMMVGLPGRFLKRPEKYTLVHVSERQPGDEPLVARWLNGSSPLSDWCVRTEEDIESSQLTPVGSFIISECRRKLYHDCKAEESRGNTVSRIYIDSFTTSSPIQPEYIGGKRGKYKVKVYSRVTIVSNRFMGYNEQGEFVLKAPGLEEDSKERQEIISCMTNVPP